MDEPPEGLRHSALAAPSRRRILDELHSSVAPLDAATLAAATGLHVTTARFHLDVLERAGLVQRITERSQRPGRPRHVYRAVPLPDHQAAPEQLADVLAGALASEPASGIRWAERAGRRWAEQLAPDDEGLCWDEGTRRVGNLFAQLGFAPRLVDTALDRRIELDGCPFRDLAKTYPDIVCTVHLGLLRGALRRFGVPDAEQATLHPFVSPELCRAIAPPPPSAATQRTPG